MSNKTLDRLLPDFHFHEIHSILIKASAAGVWRALKEVTPWEIPLFRALFAVRALPAILTRKAGIPYGGRQPLLEQMLASGFVLLAEEANREIVLGAVGQFWKPFGQPLALANPQEFLVFDRPDYAKGTMSMSVENDTAKGQVIVSTETRVFVPCSSTRSKMRAYWLLIKPGRGLIRSMWLRAIKCRAERQEGK
jgi:hypothetical protein